MTNLDSILKSREIILPTKFHVVKAVVFSSSHVWMWELDHKEGWAPKNWCLWIVILEKSLENPLDSKIKPFSPKRNQFWIFIGRTDAEAETPILWPPDVKRWLIGKTLMLEWLRAGGEGGVRRWDGWMTSLLNRHGFEQTSGDSKRQGSLVCCSPWGHKELGMTEELNNNKKESNNELYFSTI